jgi:hypothetical protein
MRDAAGPASLPEPGSAGGEIVFRRSASVDGTAAAEIGGTDVPGTDCTPGTPGNENKSLNDGKDNDE